ncbi:MAG: ammonium transporter [Bauldia sp.]|nr:ammonium transporter [Bauldia sp.]MCW5718909.1 ammonium transporter [Bauldia sp.]
MIRKLIKPALGGVALLAGSVAAWAQEVAPPVVEAIEEAAPVLPESGDTTWMMVSSLLVLMMLIPGLALFYGGMVRSKNVLSILMQCTMIGAVVMLVWAFWGYSFAFGDAENAIFGGFGKAFLSGVTADSMAATFTDHVIPEYVFIAFQMTFAAITAALIVGGFAERIKFFPLMVFIVLWVTAVYFPIAHMVWDSDGLMYGWGTYDFAGGTVVHINAGITGFVGAVFLGKRLGFGKDNMAPHNVPYVLIGAALLWVGWFGFNAGSNLEANGFVGLPFINTFLATAAAAVAWAIVEGLAKGKASVVGAASGIVAGLVAVTPAAGFVGPMGAIVLGAIASVACYFFCASVKKTFGYDDSLDVFGLHAVGGIIGAIGTGILASPSLGGYPLDGYVMGTQIWIQIKAVALTIAWSGIGSLILYAIVNVIFGLRASPEQEREGLDYGSHGEVAYHS